MAKVTVNPSGITFDIAPGETVLEAAGRANYRWPSVCGGEGQCRTCYIVIDEGNNSLSPIGPLEQEGLDTLKIVAARHRKPVRLACQTHTSDDITVQRTGVKKNES